MQSDTESFWSWVLRQVVKNVLEIQRQYGVVYNSYIIQLRDKYVNDRVRAPPPRHVKNDEDFCHHDHSSMRVGLIIDLI